MKFVRFVNNRCRDTSYISSLTSTESVVIDSLSDSQNVALHFVLNGQPLQINWSSKSRDLFDLAAIVYMADELCVRNESWSRQLKLQVPVYDSREWIAHEDKLIDALEFLTGDDFSIDWLQMLRPPNYPSHRLVLPRGAYDVVCLFSGGLDSLLGAISMLNEGKRVLLVGHYADSITSTAQRDLYKMLDSRFPKHVDLVQCSLMKARRSDSRFKLPEEHEESHRARSFLFLSIGVAVAVAANIPRIVLAENGLIALNPPLGFSRTGSLSTRTAHPRYLSLFIEFINALGAYNGHLENPFLYMSKTDMLHGVEVWQRPLILRSISCAHASTSVRWTKKEDRAPHCGYCVPCIYRRLALKVAGLDRSEDYCVDVFRDLSSLSPAKQEDFRFLSRFARRLVVSSRNELKSIVVSHGGFPAEVGAVIGNAEVRDYNPWAEMLKRWADHFNDCINTGASTTTKKLLGYA